MGRWSYSKRGRLLSSAPAAFGVSWYHAGGSLGLLWAQVEAPLCPHSTQQDPGREAVTAGSLALGQSSLGSKNPAFPIRIHSLRWELAPASDPRGSPAPGQNCLGSQNPVAPSSAHAPLGARLHRQSPQIPQTWARLAPGTQVPGTQVPLLSARRTPCQARAFKSILHKIPSPDPEQEICLLDEGKYQPEFTCSVAE